MRTVSHQSDNTDREVIKRNQIEILEMESTITKGKNSLVGFTSRFEQAERVRKLEDRSNEIIRSENGKERMKKNQQKPEDLQDTIKCIAIHIKRV